MQRSAKILENNVRLLTRNRETFFRYQLEKLWTLGPKFDDLTREVPSFKEVMEKVSDQGLFELYDPGDRAEYVDDVEIVNPWEIEYKGDSDPKLEEDEDAYII